MPWGPTSGEKRLEILDRPLIPVLFFFVSGIITGGALLSFNQYLYLPLAILTASLIIITSISRHVFLRLTCLFLIFSLVGIILVFTAAIQPSMLLELADGKKRVVLEGTVLNQETIVQERSRFYVSVEAAYLDGDPVPVRERVAVTVYDNIVDLDPGQRIRFPASLGPFKNFNNPGRYDYEGAMNLKGISCRASVSDGRYIVQMGMGDLGITARAMEAVRAPIRRLIADTLSPVNQAVYRAILLGETQSIGYELRESFNRTGLGHVLCVSGMHVGLVAVASFAFLRFLFSLSYGLMLRTDIRRLSALVTCLCVFAYTFIAGFQVSAKRAMIMAITYLLSIVIGREKDSWSTLALAAVIVLALDPNDLFSASFQLSFMAVAGIFWISPRIYAMVRSLLKDPVAGDVLSRMYIYFSSLLVITLSAVLFLLPVTTYYFNRISIAAVPVNLLVQPILGLWILPVGLLSVVFLPVSYTLSSLILKTGALGMDCMMNIIRSWSNLSWSSFLSISPNLFEVALCYGMIICLIFSLKGRAWAKKGLVLVLVASLADVAFWVYETRFNRDLRVTFIDVGQGNSALVQFPGKKRMLIDGGGFSGSTYDTGRMVVAPFLLRKKVGRIDYIVLSHPHPDHMNGLGFIAEYFDPEEFWYNGQDVASPEFIDLMNTVNKNNVMVLSPEDLTGERDISGVKIEVLHPPVSGESWGGGGSGESKGLNNNSMVLRISCKGGSILFPGDIEEEGERAVVKNAESMLDSDILLVPHHGSRSSSTEAFVKAVSPEISVISCGKDNSFGFPHKDVIERLKDAGSGIIRIDEGGAVRITIKEDGLTVKRFIDPG